jgi:hypothetical protein
MLPVSISFPGMRQSYFYSQTVSKEFSSLLENLLRLHFSFTLYLCSSFISHSFLIPSALFFLSPLFPIFLNKPLSFIFPFPLFPYSNFFTSLFYLPLNSSSLISIIIYFPISLCHLLHYFSSFSSPSSYISLLLYFPLLLYFRLLSLSPSFLLLLFLLIFPPLFSSLFYLPPFLFSQLPYIFTEIFHTKTACLAVHILHCR